MNKGKCTTGSGNVERIGVTGSQSTSSGMEGAPLTLYGEELSPQCPGVTVLLGEWQLC